MKLAEQEKGRVLQMEQRRTLQLRPIKVPKVMFIAKR